MVICPIAWYLRESAVQGSVPNALTVPILAIVRTAPLRFLSSSICDLAVSLIDLTSVEGPEHEADKWALIVFFASVVEGWG